MDTKRKSTTEVRHFAIQPASRFRSFFVRLTGLCFLSLLMTFGGPDTFGQGVGISEVSIVPHASSILELRSAERGLLVPRMTVGQRDAISNPSNGLIIYNIDSNKLNIYDEPNSIWRTIFSGGIGINNVLGESNRITIDDTDPANPIVDIASTYEGQTTITTLGTVGTGTWQGAEIGIAYGGTGATTAGDARTNLGLVIGTDVQAYDAGLTSIAGLTTAADQMLYTMGSDTYAVTDLTAAGRSLLDDTDASAQRTTLGLGTIAIQDADNVTISGGAIDGTSVGGTTPAAGTFTTLSSTDLTVTNTISGSVSGTALNVTGTVAIANGGTGQTTATAAFDALSPMTSAGDLIYGGIGGAGARLADGTSGQVLTTDGGGALSWETPTVGTVTSVNGIADRITIDDTDAANPIVDIATTYTGQTSITTLGTVGTGTWQGTEIGIAYGGTGAATAIAAFDALSPIIAAGDIIYGGAGGTGTPLSAGSPGEVLRMNSGGTAPEWAAGGSGTVTSVSVVAANGLNGTVANASTTPAITLSTTINGILKGDGTAISAATPGTDFENPLTFNNGLTRATNTITADLSTGVSGGQSVTGGTDAGDDLTITSTTNATKGLIQFGTSAYDESNNRLGIGTTTPTAALQLKAGTASAGTAPLKFTSGTKLTAPEAGAVEYDGTNLTISDDASVRYTLAKTLTATATLDFPATASRTSSDRTVTVSGAQIGDAVSIGVPHGSVNADSNYTAWVSAADEVTIRFSFYNNSSSDPASGIFRVTVFKY